ncbi:MAG: PIN domain-containing protein [Vicinamibacteraceae bacterium]
MIVYVDTSVLLRLALGEPDPLSAWTTAERAMSSELARVEALRTIDRARISHTLADDVVSERRAGVLRLLDGLDLVALETAVLVRSAEPFPTALGTLDAIHLSTALMARDQHPELVFATHDRALATGARAVGFRVVGAPT